MQYKYTVTCLLICSFFFSACSANRLLSSWTEKSLDQYTLGKVLVVGVANDETKRRIYEDTFVSSLEKIDVLAVPSYTICKQAIEPSTEDLKEVVEKSEAGAVLITHLVGKNEADYSHPSQQINSIDTHFSHGLYRYYPAIYYSVYAPGNYSGTTKVILETNLYDVQTEKLIWSARSESIDPVMTRKYYQKLISLFLDDLVKQNIIQQP